jgi:hypothetical protein
LVARRAAAAPHAAFVGGRVTAVVRQGAWVTSIDRKSINRFGVSDRSDFDEHRLTVEGLLTFLARIRVPVLVRSPVTAVIGQ